MDPKTLRERAKQSLAKAQELRDRIASAAQDDAETIEAEELGRLYAEIDELVSTAQRDREAAETLERLDTATAAGANEVPPRAPATRGDGAQRKEWTGSLELEMPRTPTRRVPAEARDHEIAGWMGFGQGHGLPAATDFMQAVAAAAQGIHDSRLEYRAAAAGNQEAVGSQGGYLVPPSFSREIWDRLNEDADNLLSLVDQIPIDGESVVIPANAEVSRVNGSRYGGMSHQWIEEAGTTGISKPVLRRMELRTHELMVMCAATDKLLRNAPAFETYIRRAATEEIQFAVGSAIFDGDGSGKPLGILNHASVITVAKETGQAADTFTEENVARMFVRLHSRARPGALWLINQNVDHQLLLMNRLVKNVAGTENVGGFTSQLYNPDTDRLLGMRVVRLEYSKPLGDRGDVLLLNPRWYAAGIAARRRQIDIATSMHVYFSTAEQAFRFMFQVGGQPYMQSALTPFQGDTLSWCVALADRA